MKIVPNEIPMEAYLLFLLVDQPVEFAQDLCQLGLGPVILHTGQGQGLPYGEKVQLLLLHLEGTGY